MECGFERSGNKNQTAESIVELSTDPLSIVTLLALIIWVLVDKVLPKYRKNATQDEDDSSWEKLQEILEIMRVQLRDLHSWHNLRDDDGRPLWYKDTGLREAVEENTSTMRILSDHIKSLIQTIKDEKS